MANLETYTKKLAPWFPGVILPTLAWGVTIAELVLGLLLIVGLWRKPTAALAALLTLSFALSMRVVLGHHEPLNYSLSVFAFASLYLGLSQAVHGGAADQLSTSQLSINGSRTPEHRSAA
jgi:uncharacterized membrane protein YphA (DoxX/SURF4 family)